MADERNCVDFDEDEGNEDAACGKGCGQEPMGCSSCSKMGRGNYPDDNEYDEYDEYDR